MRNRRADGTFAPEHGGRRTRLYGVWIAMRGRCHNPHTRSFPHYGARGIRVCPEWDKSFEAFRGWALANGYEQGLTIDRIDTGGNYEPGNCRWATKAQQNRNYSRNHLITYNGRTQCLTDWCAEFGINRGTAYYRITHGWPLHEAFGKGRAKWTQTTTSQH